MSVLITDSERLILVWFSVKNMKDHLLMVKRIREGIKKNSKMSSVRLFLTVYCKMINSIDFIVRLLKYSIKFIFFIHLFFKG